MKLPKTLRWQPTGRTLGAGAQAQVQAVVDSADEFSGTYALKALANGKPRQAYDRFHREICAIKKVQHPNIIRVVDASDPEASFHYYVMELVEGAKPLESVLFSPESPFLRNPLAAVDLFKQIVDAIQACQLSDPKVVHRDLSPANVLLIPDRTIRVIDFGICQIADEETITLKDEGVGTVNYMAPECESGAAGSVDTHSDLYSAGKILWSALTGQRAFSREKPAFTTKSPSKLFPDLPDTWHLYRIFSKTIRHNPRDRWSVAEKAAYGCNAVKRLIRGGYPPIEAISTYVCPVCGVGDLTIFPTSHMVFGNPNPAGIVARQCDYCGMCFAINHDRLKKSIKEMESLE